MDKYVVYRTDLKFKDKRNIDPNKAEWFDENVKKMYYSDNHDTLEARLMESKKEDYQVLDLSNMNLEVLPNLPKEICMKVRDLFLSDNKLSGIIDMSAYPNLNVLDLGHNNITEIKGLTGKLIELDCNDNKITTLKIPPLLKLLDCNDNKLEDIPESNSMVHLKCNNNRLTEIKRYTNLKKLTCTHNPIININELPNINIIDCSNTKLTVFDCRKYLNLKIFISNNSGLEKFAISNTIESLEIIDTKIGILDFGTNLKHLVCNLNTKISSSYKNRILDHSIHKGVIFVCNLDNFKEI